MANFQIPGERKKIRLLINGDWITGKTFCPIIPNLDILEYWQQWFDHLHVLSLCKSR